MMGQQGGGENVFRIDGRTASIQECGNRSELSVFLVSDAILKLESRGGSTDTETLKKMAESLPLSKLDAYLKGQVA